MIKINRGLNKILRLIDKFIPQVGSEDVDCGEKDVKGFVDGDWEAQQAPIDEIAVD